MFRKVLTLFQPHTFDRLTRKPSASSEDVPSLMHPWALTWNMRLHPMRITSRDNACRSPAFPAGAIALEAQGSEPFVICFTIAGTGRRCFHAAGRRPPGRVDARLEKARTEPGQTEPVAVTTTSSDLGHGLTGTSAWKRARLSKLLPQGARAALEHHQQLAVRRVQRQAGEPFAPPSQPRPAQYSSLRRRSEGSTTVQAPS